jgi:predicted Zn-dependent protease
VAVDMDNVERFRRAQTLLSSHDPHAALQVLQPLLADEPDAVAVLELAARASYDTGRLARAEALFRRVVELDPAHHYAYAGLGRTLSRAGRHREALPHLRMATAMNPESWYLEALQRAERAVAGSRTPAEPQDAPEGRRPSR